jgi:uncharacterized protein (DUF488 family)
MTNRGGVRVAGTVYTIGHSTRPLDEFLAILRAHSIERLVDVRTVPRSRRNPQFEQVSLMQSLPRAGIEYRHMKALGGLRKPRPDSANIGWRNASFRGYADYMQSEEFAAAIEELIALAAARRTAVMCAEVVPWRCHRSLIGDALGARGVPVLDILSAEKAKPHELTSFARVDGTRITYPAAQSKLF